MILKEMKSLNEIRVSHEVYDADPADLLEFGTAYASLGDMIQQQIQRALEEGNSNVISNGAMEYIRERLYGFNGLLDEMIDSYDPEAAKYA